MLPYIAFMDPMGLLANHPMTRYPTLALPPSERRNGPGPRPERPRQRPTREVSDQPSSAVFDVWRRGVVTKMAT